MNILYEISPIILLFMALVIILIYSSLFTNEKEGFDKEGFDKNRFNKNIWAYDENMLDNEYKPAIRPPIFPNKGITNKKELNAVKFETRLPELIKQRYSYNDVRQVDEEKCYPSLNNNYAVLKELPINNYQNNYHTTLPRHIAYKYYKGNMEDISKVISKNQKDIHLQRHKSLDKAKDYNIYRSCSGECLVPINSLVPNRVVGIDQYGNDLSVPHDPMSQLPANYADRSKTSIERLLAADLNSSFNDPVHGLLPFER